jgi:hypothetical protein
MARNSVFIFSIKKTLVLMVLSLIFLAKNILKIFRQVKSRRRNAIIAFSLCR